MKYHAIIIALESKIKTRGLPSKKLIDTIPYVKSSSFLKATTPDTLNENDVHPHVLATIKKDRRAYLSWYDLSNIKQAACAVSHIRAWQQVVYYNQPCLISEDDIMHYSKILKKTEHVLKNIEHESRCIHMVSLLHLGSNGIKGSLKNITESPNKIYKINHSFYGLQLYYLTPEGARILLKWALPVCMHIDRYVSDCVNKGFCLYKAGKSICGYNFLNTTLSHSLPKIFTVPIILSSVIVFLVIIIVYKNHKIKKNLVEFSKLQ